MGEGLQYSGFIRVPENLESPKILLWHFPRLGSSENLLYSSNKVFRISVLRNACRQERELILKSWEWNGLSWNLESWKNQSEFWESPWNLFLKKGTNPENCFSLHARNTGINWKDGWASWLEYRLYLNFKLVKD